MPQFRIIDLQHDVVQPDDLIVEARTPEAAALSALGVELVRSGSRRELRARVYWQHPGQPLSMVRLYSKVSASHDA